MIRHKTYSFFYFSFERLIIYFIFFLNCNVGLNAITSFSLLNYSQSIFFIENKGQYNFNNVAEVFYKTHIAGADIYITEKGLSYLFACPKDNTAFTKITDSTEFKYERFDIDLKDANISKENFIVENESKEDYHFVYGHCPDGIYNVKSFQKVLIKNVYPGIDWLLYGTMENGLKYDFIVHENAKPSAIQMVYKTLNKPYLKNGNLQLPVFFGSFQEKQPISYLEKDNQKIKSQFEIRNQIKKYTDETNFYETEIGFKISHYDKKQTLIIDPLQLWWGTYFGGSEESDGVSITTDSIGNVFVLGNTNSLDLPTAQYGTLTYFQGTYSGSNGGGVGDAYILKFTNQGQLLWSTYFGGSQIDRGAQIKCDNAGNVFVTGYTSSVNFPVKNPGGGAYFMAANSSTIWIEEIFISKFSNDGRYIWGTYYGTPQVDIATALSIDSGQNVLVTGTTNSPSFPVYNGGNGAYFQNNFGGGFFNFDDAFILKFSNAGNLLHATYFGGSGWEKPFSIACDKLGNSYIGGYSTSSNLFVVNPQGGAFYQNTLLAPGGNFNAFLLKLNSNAQAIWSTYLGGCCSDRIVTMACDSKDNLFVAGSTSSYNFPYVNPGGGAYFSNSFLGGGVILKFNKQSQMIWSTKFGSSGSATGNLTIGKCDEVYLTNPLAQNNPNQLVPIMDAGNGAYYDSTYNNDLQTSYPDIFISAFTNSGVQRWGTFFGGKGSDDSMLITTDKDGNIFYTGNQGSNGYSNSYQSYTTTCIKNPGNGAFYMQTPTPSTFFPYSSVYSVIGKFTGPLFNSNFLTSGCGSTNSATLQPQGWGPYTYTWSNGSFTSAINNANQGQYSYSITDQFLGCEQFGSLFLGVPSLTFNISATNSSICKGQKTIISANGANQFQWSPAQFLSNTNGYSVTAFPNTTTVFSVTGINAPNCKTDSTFIITVNPLPVINIAGKDSACKGTLISYSAQGASTYKWFSESKLISISSAINFSTTQNSSFNVIGTDNKGCIDSININLKVIEYPKISVLGSTLVCLNNGSTLTISGANEFLLKPEYKVLKTDKYNWFFSTAKDTSYVVVGTNSKMCVDSISFKLKVVSNPTLIVQKVDSMCSDAEFKLNAIGSGNFRWHSDHGSIKCDSCSLTFGKISSTSKYYISLIDKNSCETQDSIMVNLKDGCEPILIVPNIFTPNNDGINDYFKIRSKYIQQIECIILNRWNQQIASFKTLDGYWDGGLPNGSKCAEGVYFYFITGVDIKNKVFSYKGSLQLSR